jgi:hypothetical protein
MADCENIIYVGEDRTITLSLRDENGAAFSVDNLEELRAFLFVDSLEVAKFALTAETGFQLATTEAPDKVILKIDRSITTTFPVGSIHLEVHADSSDGGNGKRHISRFKLGKVKFAETFQQNG